MASSFVTIDASAMRRIVRRVGVAQQTVAKPLASTRGAEAMKILRFGTRGIRDQFAAQTEYRGNSAIPWARTKPFGIKPAPAKTMHGSGAYRSAFLGGAGAVQRITANSIEVGVNSGRFPQVKVHQGAYATRRIKPKEKVSSGRNKGQWKMRFYLGLTYGVWMKNATLTKGLKLPRRRVSVASATRKEISRFLARDIKVKLRAGASL